MTDYISREAAKIAVCRSRCRTYCQRGVCELTEAIRKIPAADVREVVYCKDCKWYKESTLLPPNKFCFRLIGKDGKHIGYNFSEKDFCSYGVRAEQT